MLKIPFQWNSDGLREQAHKWVIDIAAEVQDYRRVISDMENALPELDETAPGDTQRAETTESKRERWWGYAAIAWPHEFDRLIERLRRLVLCETGIALLRCGSDLTGNQARLIELILGCRFGLNITITAQQDKRPLFALEVKKDSTAKGQYAGNGLRGNQIGFHTDGSGSTDREVELLSMLCIRPARFGGQSRVANSQVAFAWLPPETQELLQREFSRQNPYDPNLEAHQLKKAPIFRKVVTECSEYMYFSYHLDRIRNGIRKSNAFVTEPESEAFTLLEEALEKFSCDINLMANEILFLNNTVIAHDRRPFWDDASAARLLERFWAGTLTELHKTV